MRLMGLPSITAAEYHRRVRSGSLRGHLYVHVRRRDRDGAGPQGPLLPVRLLPRGPLDLSVSAASECPTGNTYCQVAQRAAEETHMSRGLGRVQREVLAILDEDEDGAWTVGDLCRRVYPGINRPEKSHRVAVARALRKMRLPGGWLVRRLEKVGGEYAVFNIYSLNSRLRYKWMGGWAHWSFEDFVTDCENTVAREQRLLNDAVEYRDASESRKLNIQIANRKQLISLSGVFGSSNSSELRKELAALILRRQQLAADEGEEPSPRSPPDRKRVTPPPAAPSSGAIVHHEEPERHGH